jgi:hypothetical protein
MMAILGTMVKMVTVLVTGMHREAVADLEVMAAVVVRVVAVSTGMEALALVEDLDPHLSAVRLPEEAVVQVVRVM